METTQTRNSDNSVNDWQLAETTKDNSKTTTNEVDLRSAEAGGFGTDDDQDDALYATDRNDEDEDDDDDEEDDADDDDDDANDDDSDRDWGHVDPAERNSPFPDSNDPSGPGSAV